MHRILSGANLALLFRFGLVGILATLIHYGVALFASYAFNLDVQLSNAIGFGSAFLFSFMGHWLFTFKTHLAPAAYLTRFIGLGALNWLISALIVYASASAGLSDSIALSIMALLIPIFSFLVNRFFVFVDHDQEPEAKILLPVTLGLILVLTALNVMGYLLGLDDLLKQNPLGSIGAYMNLLTGFEDRAGIYLFTFGLSLFSCLWALRILRDIRSSVLLLCVGVIVAVNAVLIFQFMAMIVHFVVEGLTPIGAKIIVIWLNKKTN